MPLRVKLGFVVSQALKTVEPLTVLKDEVGDAIPKWRQSMRIDAGQRRHPEVECFETLLMSPQHELNEQKLHRASRRVVVESHQVNREFLFVVSKP